MTRFQKWVAVVVSAVFVLAAGARLVCPSLLIDEKTVALLALGLVPWLTLFFKKFKLPGGFEGETRERAQSTTEKPLAPAATMQAPLGPGEHLGKERVFSPDALRILATLWRYQKQHFREDVTRRWTFAVFPNAAVYPSYLRGLAEVVNEGLVAVLPDYQVHLTNEGINYVRQHPEIQSRTDVYTF